MNDDIPKKVPVLTYVPFDTWVRTPEGLEKMSAWWREETLRCIERIKVVDPLEFDEGLG